MTREADAETSELAPLHPAIHLAPRRGWMNDPNGLCYSNGVWHAFYQYDPTTDVHGVMHWGHSTSTDLLRWNEQPIALAPDDLGVIFSGSAVVDTDNTAGFGTGAMVAIFTHHRPETQRQSLAYSLDDGTTWTKYADNPVLESTEPDFRDPKVRRYTLEGRSVWIMTLAVGRRVEFYRSPDLKNWTLCGRYDEPLPTAGVWECPDLVSVSAPDGTQHWFLTVGVIDGGPQGHSGTYAVPGDFDGDAFTASGPASLLDHGPDYYAAQSFWGAPEDACVQMGWLSSWRYAQTHPSNGRRGMLSIPRRLHAGAATESGLQVVPYPDLASFSSRVDGHRWRSEPGRAVHIVATGDIDVTIGQGAERVVRVRIAAGVVTLERRGDQIEQFDQTYTAPCAPTGRHELVIDHGTVEAFAADGSATISALWFAGRDWGVHLDGDGMLAVI